MQFFLPVALIAIVSAEDVVSAFVCFEKCCDNLTKCTVETVTTVVKWIECSAALPAGCQATAILTSTIEAPAPYTDLATSITVKSNPLVVAQSATLTLTGVSVPDQTKCSFKQNAVDVATKCAVGTTAADISIEKWTDIKLVVVPTTAQPQIVIAAAPTKEDGAVCDFTVTKAAAATVKYYLAAIGGDDADSSTTAPTDNVSSTEEGDTGGDDGASATLAFGVATLVSVMAGLF